MEMIGFYLAKIKINMYNIFLIYSKMLYIQKHRSCIEAKEKQEHEDFLLKILVMNLFHIYVYK